MMEKYGLIILVILLGILCSVLIINYLNAQHTPQQDTKFYSQTLAKELKITLFLPPNYRFSFRKYPVLYLNDGQDVEALKLAESLQNLYRHKTISPLIIVAIHTDNDRMRDYGTSIQADYKNRGDKAKAYQQFVIHELVPFIQKKYRTQNKAGIAGFSLGGLSAFDIAWHHPELFNVVGVFSGSFWWRKNPYQKPEDDFTDRLAHLTVRQTQHPPDLRFWFQAGTKDETSDRNQNGIIDAIEDTLDLIKELEIKGLETEKHIFYDQIEGGEHHFGTWSRCFPTFLKQFYGKN